MITHSSLDPFGMQPHLHKNPQPAGLLLLWWPVFLSIGIGWYFCLSKPPAPLMGWSALAAIIALGGATRRWRHTDAWRWIVHGLCAVALGFSLIQFKTDRITIEPLRYPSFGRPLQGTIESAEYVRGGWRVVLDDVQLEPDPRYLKYWRDSDELKRYRIRVTVRSRNFHPEIGQRIRMHASLIAPSGELLPGMFDFRRHAFYQEFSGYGYSNMPVELLKDAPDEFHGLEHYRQYIAQRVKEFLLHYKFDKQQSVIGLSTAFLNGQRAGIDKQAQQDMQRSGLQHLISISGYHVSLLAAIVFFTVRFLMALSMNIALRLPIKKIAAFVALLAIIVYMLIIGMSAPTVRSVLSTGVVLIAVMLDREAITLRLVAIAAALILLIQPDSLMTPGFQMSFSAVAALVVFYQKTTGFWVHPFWRSGILARILFVLVGSVATTLVASVATAPLAVYHFQQLPMLSVIANVLVTPVMAFIVMPATVLAYLTMMFDGAGSWVMWYMGYGVEKTLQIAHWVAQSDWSLLRLRGIETAQMVSITIGTLWLMTVKDRKAWLGLIPMMIGVIASFFTTQPVLALLPTQGRSIIYAPPHEEVVYYEGRMDKFTQDLLLQFLAKEQMKPLTPDIALPPDIYLVRDIPEIETVCKRPEKILISRWYIDQQCKNKTTIDRHALNKNGTGIVVIKK